MSVNEVVAALNLKLEADALADLAETLAAADEIVQLEEQEPETAFIKLALVVVGSTLYAKFMPGDQGSGPITQKGFGGFADKATPPSLKGNYTLVVGFVTVKLLDGAGKTVWSGKGLQKGLYGKWEIKF